MCHLALHITMYMQSIHTPHLQTHIINHMQAIDIIIFYFSATNHSPKGRRSPSNITCNQPTFTIRYATIPV